MSRPQAGAAATETDAGKAAVIGALERAGEALLAARNVALACHVNPDPDAIGSMLGLALWLKSQRKDVVCSWGNDPLQRPRWLSVLPGSELIVEAQAFPANPEVMVALDTASPDRLGPLGANAEAAECTIVIDHHRTNPGFGSIVVLDPDASSTSEMVFRLIQSAGGPLTAEIAACLYAGIVTDTGRFQYESTSPETHRVAAELRTLDFDHTAISRALYEDISLSALRLSAIALERVVHVPELSLAWTYVLQADLSVDGVDMSETDDLIDFVRVAREADVTCVIKQQRDGNFKVSLRSKGQTDVGAVAKGFGGGGHRLAAGFTSHTGVAETVRRVEEALRSVR
ncbi:MAG TPA: bifunctional oligoribonuclease/PAP phosphatase NrnA [Actinomycetota bacterium]|nr:bifunctional oligoribonuclease/PAP phosphatase NrnA [Actinomycetota bacterium]